MKHLETFESFLNEAKLNEVRSYEAAYLATYRRQEDERHRGMLELFDFADTAMKALPAIMKKNTPGIFNTRDLGFGMPPGSSTAYVFANGTVADLTSVETDDVKRALETLNRTKEFQKYFDYGALNSTTTGWQTWKLPKSYVAHFLIRWDFRS